jgi:Mn-containing catalase
MLRFLRLRSGIVRRGREAGKMRCRSGAQKVAGLTQPDATPDVIRVSPAKDDDMFLHRKELIQPVKVGKPDARFGTFLLEQFGGATGELTAALQYWVQSFHVENAGIRDMLQDIAIEEFSHLEMVGQLIAQHTSKIDQTAVYDAPLFRLKGGGPHFLDSQGSCWTAAYINEGGNVVRDLRADIAAEAGARQTYEALIKACDDEGSKKVLTHLLTREITHANMFMKALESMDKLDDPMFGNIEPDETVKLVFNLSQGDDIRGPWNEEPDFDYIENPEPEGGMPPAPVNADDEGHRMSKKPAKVR